MQPAPEGGRKRVGDLLRARVKELGDLQDLALLDLHFLAHPHEAAGANLEVGDAHGVLVGHGERELARGFRQQGAGAGRAFQRP